MKDITNLLYEISSLRMIPRAHRQQLGYLNDSDNIASHSHLVSIIAYFIAKKENANMEKVLLMALTHDLAESRTGDLSWINKRYVKDFEQEALTDAFGKTDYREIIDLHHEYSQRKTLEAKIVKDADRIAQLVVLKELISSHGNQRAQIWMQKPKPFFTKTGQELADNLLNSDASKWGLDLETSKRK